jgi:hypothetical protein
MFKAHRDTFIILSEVAHLLVWAIVIVMACVLSLHYVQMVYIANTGNHMHTVHLHYNYSCPVTENLQAMLTYGLNPVKCVSVSTDASGNRRTMRQGNFSG